MQINIELTEKDLRIIIVKELQRRAGDIPVSPDKVRILVKSAQNYKAEWEEAQFRATFSTDC